MNGSIVLCALFALIAVSSATQCGTLQRIKVKMQWAQAYSAGIDRSKFGNSLWTK